MGGGGKTHRYVDLVLWAESPKILGEFQELQSKSTKEHTSIYKISIAIDSMVGHLNSVTWVRGRPLDDVLPGKRSEL